MEPKGLAMKHLHLRLSDDEYEQFAKILFERGRVKQQAALLAAVRQWMKAPGTAVPERPKKNNQTALAASLYNVERKWWPYFRKLARIFISRNRRAISAVTGSIDVFEDYVRIHEAQKEKPGQGG
jgi:hypothetical protein